LRAQQGRSKTVKRRARMKTSKISNRLILFYNELPVMSSLCSLFGSRLSPGPNHG
jgi:hypothetical protein